MLSGPTMKRLLAMKKKVSRGESRATCEKNAISGTWSGASPRFRPPSRAPPAGVDRAPHEPLGAAARLAAASWRRAQRPVRARRRAV